MPYYAVAKGRSPGVFQTWGECQNQVKGFKGARFKKFDSQNDAERFVSSGGQNAPITVAKKNAIPSTATSSAPKAFATVPPKKITTNNDAEFDNFDNLHDEIMRKMDQIEKEVGEIKNSVLKKPSRSRKAVLIDPAPVSRSSPLKRSAESTSSVPNKRIMMVSNKDGSHDFEVDDSGYVVVYTDGACSGNGTSAARAGLGVYFGEDHPLNVSESVSGRATNNCGEIQATTKAIQLAHSKGVKKLSINTDSQFVINSVNKWMNCWKKRGWKLASGGPVKNATDFKELDKALTLDLEVKWNYVNAHKGILGNERADQLAKAGAEKYGKKKRN